MEQPAQAVSVPAPFIRVLPLNFTGNGYEYFRIWIVNLFLTVITLGIYSAWAKVRKLRYFYGNTWVDDNAFSYLGDPVKILKGRIIAVGFVAIYSLAWNFFPDAAMAVLALGVLAFPFFLVTAMSFQLRNSAYRNIRFFFNRDYREVYRIFIVPIAIVLLLTWLAYSMFDVTDLLTEAQKQNDVEFNKADLLPSIFMLALMPVIPYLDYLRMRYIVNHTQYGKRKASFSAGGWDFYKVYLMTFLMFIVFMIIGIVIMTVCIAVIVGLTGGADAKSIFRNAGVFIITMTIFYGLGIVVSGYMRARRTNIVYGSTAFGEININSKLKFLPVAWIYLSNVFAVLFSLGLLIPWTKIRMMRYVAGCTELESRDLGDVAQEEGIDPGALGQEMFDAFDLDIGL